MSPSTKWQRLLTRIALAFLRGIRRLGLAGLALGRALRPVVRPLAMVAIRWLILPFYKFLVLLKLRLSRLMLTARGLLFLLFTNRYVFHAVLLLISILTITTQLRARGATAFESGQHSLLYTIVTNGQDEIIEEEVRPEMLAKNSHYLGPDTIEGLPDIDYDYDESDLPLADLNVPGAIAVLPGSEEPGVPGETVPTRTRIETYAVEAGDTVASIARKFGVSVGTVAWANNLTQRSIIRPGDPLTILPVSGVLHKVKKGDTVEKIAKQYRAEQEEILATNRLAPNHTLALGEPIIVPGGTPPEEPRPIARTTRPVRPDVPISRIRNKSLDLYQELTQTDTREKPKDAEETEAAKKTKLLWPTSGRRITQYYGWRHTGVDIDGDYVDPIYASADGVVEKSGWNNGGYGLQILVEHPNGMRTRYAHASKLFVKAGDAVKRGQVIAMVGTTGRSTGTHLHYEVYVNNKRVNPLAYTR